MSRSRLRRLLAAVLLLALPAVLFPGVVSRAALLATQAESARSYFLTGHVVLVYGLAPLVVLSATILFFAPGLFLALAAGRASSVATWLLTASGISLIVVSVVAGTATAATAGRLSGSAFGLPCLVLTAGCAAIAGWRLRRASLPWPLGNPSARFTLGLCVLVPLLLLLLVAPKFLWESFNGDGAHAFESSRLLLHHALPFWPESAGEVAHFPGLTSMLFAFPNGWYLRLFGPVEAAVRLPFLLYLAALAAAILAVAEHGPVAASRALVILVWSCLVAFALALMFSASYDPYSADVALPAAQDALLLVCFLGWVHALLQRQWGWLTLFGVLTYTASPNGALLSVFWLLATMLVVRPRPWETLGRAALVLLACIVGATLVPRLLVAAGQPSPGTEYGLAGLLRYFAFLQLTDWKRLLFVLVPCGFVPIIALLQWRRLDQVSRVLAVVSVGYFFFFFVQAHVALHHFAPAMLLPVLVAARLWSGSGSRAWRLLWQGGAICGLLLSLPRSFRIHDARREVGARISESVGNYARSDPAVLRGSTLLHELFPYDWESSVPDSSYGGSPLVWNHYALHDAVTDRSNYFLTRADRPAPPGTHLLAADRGAALYVRSDSIWRADRALRPDTPLGSPVYFISRDMLFHRQVGPARGPRIIDVVATLERLGIDVRPLLTRLGVRR